jgi:fructokinase
VIGEVLVDRFPNYERIGGAPFNFAHHLNMMGFAVRLLTRVGDDAAGRRIRERLQHSGFDEADVQVDPRHPTGTVQVALDGQGVPHFDILENVAYDHLELDRVTAADLSAAAMIYYGTLAQRTPAGHRQVRELLARSAGGTIRFCDINMRPPHLNPGAVQASLEQADLLKLNADELADIQGRFNGPTGVDAGVAWLMAAYGIGTLALTLGSDGSRLYHTDGKIEWPGEAATTVVDTVGAGDAYAAVLAAGMLLRLPWPAIVGQASRFAASVCGIPGAVPDDAGVYDELRAILEGGLNGR